MTLVSLCCNAEIDIKKTTGNGNQHVPVCLESCYVQSQDSLQVSQVNMLLRYNDAPQRAHRLSSIPSNIQLVLINE